MENIQEVKANQLESNRGGIEPATAVVVAAAIKGLVFLGGVALGIWAAYKVDKSDGTV